MNPETNLLTRGGGVEEGLPVQSGSSTVKSGCRILLFNGGITGYFKEGRKRERLNQIYENTEVLNTLIADVYDAGAGDNVTIIVGTI